MEDLKGKKFGYLEALRFEPKFQTITKPSGKQVWQGRWECVCICGTVVFAKPYSLIQKQKTCCGCKRAEKIRKTISSEKKHLIQQKREATNLKKYGGKSPASSKEVLNKMKETTLKKYGVENASQSPAIKAKKKEKGKNSGQFLKLPNGKFLYEMCAELGRVYTYATEIYRTYGPQAALDHLLKEDRSSSSLEKEAYNLLKEAIPNIKPWNKVCEVPFNKGYYKPDFKLNDTTYLDIDGLYFHSEAICDKKYHLEKREAFEKFGLRLIQIRQDELLHKTEQVKSLLRNALNLTTTKINARDTKVGEVSQQVLKETLTAWHLMGYSQGSKGLGLYHKGTLVSILTYRIKKQELEIVRFCNMPNTLVRGGLSKLIKALPNEGFDTIISWVDLRYANGISLETLGFSRVRTTLGWKWTDCKFTYNRLSVRANMDARGLSEKEYAKEKNFYKIYDAGQALYLKKKNQVP